MRGQMLPMKTTLPARISPHFTLVAQRALHGKAFPCLVLGTALLYGATSVYAAAPLLGNPVDAVPRLDSAPTNNPPRPTQPIATPTPQEQQLAARMALRLIPKYFDVTGVKSIPFEEVSALLTPLANQNISLGDLVARVDQITQMYRDRGYPLSFALVQDQTFAEGRVVVTVVEGYVATVTVTGEDVGGARDRLEALGENLTEERPLKQATLERVLNLMRTVPGVRINPVLDLPRRADGATELVLETTHQRAAATGSAADLGTGVQPLANASLNSLTPLGEQIKLTSSVPLNSDDVRFHQAEITVPISNNGMALKIDGYHYRAEPQDDTISALGFNRKVNTDRIGAAVSYPFLMNNRQLLTGSLGVYAVNSKDRYDAKIGDAFVEQRTRVRAATADLRYYQVSERASSDVTLAVSRGFDALGARKEVDTSVGAGVPPELELSFTRFNLNAKQTVQLPAQFGLVFSGTAQYSNDVLPSSEQISFGSYRYGLGYQQGARSGDKGVGLSAELNRRFNTGWPFISSIQPYTAIDYARSWYNSDRLSDFQPRHLSSAALGLRVTDDKYYLFDVNIAKPIAARAASDSDRSYRINANYSFFYGAN